MIGIHYTPVKSPDPGQRVFGVEVAVTNWLRAWFRYGTSETFNFLIGDAKEWEEVLALADGAGVDVKRLAGLDRRYLKENLGRFQTVMRLNPDSRNLFWQREQIADGGFNFCGLAHAIGGIEAGQLLEQYCLAPSRETDAIVCPSRSVQSVIRSFWDLYGDYLQQRFGTNYKCPVQLPVIPLGIDVEHYASLATPTKRTEQRKKLGLQDDDIVLLWVGRLSHAIKAHPLAMFQAAERAAEATGASVHLAMVGYFLPKEAEPQFRKLAQDICHKAKVTFIASDDVRFPDGLWAAGDIFLSLIDNMQESFGLTPIEAMAAGLPRVISDWDGYRDSVDDGEDGFLVRTTQPPPQSGEELSALLLSGREMYGGFLAKSALSVAVDQEMAAQRIVLLIKDKEKRKSIADKARERVKRIYDWRHIIPAYEALWEEMAAKRQAAKKSPGTWPSALPQAPDPFTMYAAYPSAPLAETDHLSVAASLEIIQHLWRHEMNVLALDVMIPAEDTIKLINHIASQNAVSIGSLFQAFPAFDRPRLWRTLGWLIKLGILRHKAS
ncbi:MAG: glycosyltransferase family 4 protein [Alphaproteobacteria bacterium]|nr:glycosyltransferase family 4 protein [Alphaproteobacteria bacterium]